jgi:hypothetical protein
MQESTNPQFAFILKEMARICDSKSHDYAKSDNPYSNFEFAGELGAMFNSPVDVAFATLIGVKLARLAELKKGKTPNNESVQDTHIDLANYAAIWASYGVAK